MSDSIPDSIGHFRILSKLGQGGMGSVYRAVHGTLERTVALKVLPPEFSAHPEYVSRFMREARVVASLKHENIVQIYDSGEIGGRHYIAMELVDGGNLLNVAEARVKIDEKEGLRLMLQAARGLGVAHAKGLIHRDIKPENLLLGTDGIVRLVDFGLVADSGSATQLTQAGTCLGTPMYMSSEQADGEPTDGRSDLYSLGATFYRVFTGRPPFVAATVMNTLFKQKFERPPDPRIQRPDLSENTSRLLLHLLAKRREDRPADANALIAMIEAVLAGKEIPEPPTFVPMIPKSQVEQPEPSVAPDGETAILFAGSGTRRPSIPETSGTSTLKAAVIIFVLFAGVLFFIASNSRREIAAPPKDPPVKKPTLTEAELLEQVARGDAAFREGRIRDAREIYLTALKAVPNHVELIKRRDRSDRRIKFDLDMQAAEKLERDGKLEDALVRYGEALALDEENVAQERIDRVKVALEQSKKPVAEFSAAPAPTAQEKAETEKALELERAAKSAQDFLLLQNYDRAEAAFTRAAELAPETRKAAFREKAIQSRRMNFLSIARSAEANNDFAAAEAAYLKALEISSDDATISLLNAARKKMKPPEDKNLALYKEAMREGQEAIDKGDFQTARVKFGVAMGLKPELSPPGAKLNEIEARESLLKADELVKSGDLVGARAMYLEAQGKCPTLEPDVIDRVKRLDSAPSRATIAAGKAAALANEHKDDDAVKILDEALKLDPGSQELLDAKAALKAQRRAEEITESLKAIYAVASQRFKEAAELEEDDVTKKLIKQSQANLKKITDQPAHTFTGVVADDSKSSQTSLSQAHKDATDLSTDMSKASEHFLKLSEKADDKVGVKIPGLPKIGIGGDRKKTEKFKVISDAFKALALQAKDLQK